MVWSLPVTRSAQMPEQVRGAMKELDRETDRVRQALKRYDQMAVGSGAVTTKEKTHPPPPLPTEDLEVQA